ncbi:hypothetical protein OSG_eHP33_00150, partial [environmental Halophage eHP-33]
MSATGTTPTAGELNPEEFQDTLLSLARGANTNEQKAREAFAGLVQAWNLPTTRVGPDAKLGANISLVRDKMARSGWGGDTQSHDGDPWAVREYGTRRPQLAGAAASVGASGDNSAT